MKRILSWLIGVPAALIVISIAIANRHAVSFSLDPFSVTHPWFAVSMPLYLLLMIVFIFGMIVGGLGAWLSQGKWRKEARHARSELRRMEAEQAELKREMIRQDSSPARYGT